jgi:S1-C subfamily serine protease
MIFTIGVDGVREANARRDYSTVSTGWSFDLHAMVPILAKQIVVMLEPKWNGREGSPLGAGVIVGVRRECIYIATANHVIRSEGHPADRVLVRTAFDDTVVVTGAVLPNFDEKLDLGVVCIPNPETTLRPFPRLPLTFRGLTSRLTPGEPLTVFGNGFGINWHTDSAPLVFDRVEDEMYFISLEQVSNEETQEEASLPMSNLS